jgi:hypothetical protein
VRGSKGCAAHLGEAPLRNFPMSAQPDTFSSLAQMDPLEYLSKLNGDLTSAERLEHYHMLLLPLLRLQREDPAAFDVALEEIMQRLRIKASTVRKVLARMTIDAENENSEGAHEEADSSDSFARWIDPVNGDYEVQGGQFFRWVTVNNQPIRKAISNFAARVVEDITRDDGAEEQRFFTVEGRARVGKEIKLLARRQVAAHQFENLSWLPKIWGVEPSALPAQKEHVAYAIRLLSGEVRRRVIYGHLGWRRLEGGSVYLHAGGALGGEEAEVDPDPSLARYLLPATPTDVCAGMRASLSLLDLGPARQVYPGWAGTWRASTCEFRRSTTLIYLVGDTGSLKTTYAALLLSHFGDFPGRTELPAHFEDTENAVEKLAFLAKDALLVVDDLAPEQHHGRMQEIMKRLSRLARDVGNATGRRRMRADTSLRPQYYPRGVMLATGEFLPEALAISARARMLPVLFEKGLIDVEHLTKAQAARSLLPHAMAAFILSLREHVDGLAERLTERFEVLRDQATKDAGDSPWHPMLAEHVANLYIGLELALSFAVQVDATTEGEAKQRLQTGWTALMELAREHGRHLADEKPSRLFLEAIAEGLAAGRAWLARRDSGELAVGRDIPGSEKLGWIDELGIYLLPGVAYAFTADRLRHRGGFVIGERALKEHLQRDGVLLGEGKDRFDTVKWCEKRSQRILWLHREALGDLPLKS